MASRNGTVVAGIIVEAQKLYKWTDDVADQRVKHYPFVTSPWPVLCIMGLYMLVVWYGPQWMKDRKPFSLKPIIIAYNLASVILATYIFYEMIMSAWLAKYTLPCQPVDYSNDPLAVRMANAFYWHLLARMWEVLDTIFFILRKKNEQVTFLHVYHHCTMLFHGYLAVRYIAGGNSFYWTVLNALVHVFMYTYYGLAAIGPHMQKYLGWKRYLTQMQLVQFFTFLIHSGYLLYRNIDCGYPTYYILHMHVYAITLAVLFGNFYYQAYVAKARRKQKQT